VTYTKGLPGVLRLLTPRDATLAILGNHDHWTDARLIRQLIREGGAIDICNAVYTVRRGNRQLHIGGVDDIWEHKDDLPTVLKALPGDEAAILLAHEPDFADTSAATGRFDLQLSGHSHGGQVAIPLFGPPILPRLGQKYPNGLYQVGSMFQYTNRGLGVVSPRVRFNCRPEITIFTLESPHA
jgi:predicted MPP superfamily phosphohydrolase